MSGVSSASALSAGDDSAPEVSEKSSESKALRGVVKEGLRKAGAGVDAEAKLDVCVFDEAGGFDGVAKLKLAKKKLITLKSKHKDSTQYRAILTLLSLLLS